VLGLSHNSMVCSASNGQAFNNERPQAVSVCDFSGPGLLRMSIGLSRDFLNYCGIDSRVHCLCP
jgi:hypothetical protein